MNWQTHTSVEWIEHARLDNGSFVVFDKREGKQYVVDDEKQLHELAARAARTPGSLGAGDVVAAITTALGVGKCVPCARRQATLNRLLPNVWPSREGNDDGGR